MGEEIIGTVTMDQLMVDCGPGAGVDGAPVAVGDEVVLIGEQDGPEGVQRIRAEDWADRLGTIGYEIVCGIGARVPEIDVRPVLRRRRSPGLFNRAVFRLHGSEPCETVAVAVAVQVEEE